jgi:type IV pilus assembly protein PilC
LPEYSYIARSQEGKRTEGNLTADNLTAAMEILNKKNLSVIKLDERDEVFDFLDPFIERFSLAVERMKAKIPLSDLVFFTRQISTMFSSGLTIEKSLHFLALEEKNKKFKKVIENIESNVKKGLLFSDALIKHPGIFSNLYVSLVRAGEVSGKLYETLDELSIYLETVNDTQRKVTSAMYYPVFIIGFLIAMLFVTFTWLLPRFSQVYDSLGSELPYYTILLVNAGEWFNNNIIFIFAMTSIIVVVLWFLALTDTGTLVKDQILLKLPIFGSIIEANIYSKFTKTFGILIGSGVQVLDTMKLLIRVVDNRVFELATKQASVEIENGINISAALKSTGKFPPIMIQLLATGEETGEIDGLALKASEFYTKQVNASVDRLTSIIEPALVVLVGGVIAVIVVVTYLPIFHFGEAIGN